MVKSSCPQVVAIVPSTIASCQIGVIKPLSALAHKGKINFKWYLEGRTSLNAIHAADIVVFCRNTEPAYAHLLNEAVSTNKPIIFDLDDNFWDVPFESDPELARYHRLPLRIQQLERYISHANLVRVYSPVMLEIVSQLNKHVRLLNAGFDFGLLRKPRRKRSDQRIQIVYATSRIVDSQYKIFSEALKTLLDTNGERVQLSIWGCQPSELVGHRGVRLINLVADYEKFLQEFSAEGFDIGLAPLENTHFHRSKTNTKFRDYGACKVAGVYSNVPVYSSCVEHLKTGVLVDNTPDAWLAGLQNLVADADLRHQIQENAYQKVLAEFSQEHVEDEWLAQINELLKSSTVYSLSSNTGSLSTEIVIRADFQNLSGIRFPAHSPGDGDPVGKVYLEVMSITKDVLREASTIKKSDDSGEEDILFSFTPIQNSQHKDFILRLIRVPSEVGDADANYWLPNSGYIEMIYEEAVMPAQSALNEKSSRVSLAESAMIE